LDAKVAKTDAKDAKKRVLLFPFLSFAFLAVFLCDLCVQKEADTSPSSLKALP